MSEELTREEFEERLAEMKAMLEVAANNVFASLKTMTERQLAATEASAAALTRIADALEPILALTEMYLRVEHDDEKYFPCRPFCFKDLVNVLHLETADARVQHVMACMHRVCPDCLKGVHKHLEARDQPWFKGLKDHEKIDALDCKNPSKDGQCICPEYLRAKKELGL